MKIAGRKLNRKGHLALTFLLIIMATGIAFTVKFVAANNEPVEGPVQIEEHFPDEDLKEINIVVRDGDTAWDIQSELTPNRDVLEIINQLEKLNNMSLDNIKPGSVIKFAIEG